MAEGTTWRCAVSGCDRPKNPRAAKGMCKVHYERARKAAKGKRTCQVDGCQQLTRLTLCYAHARANRQAPPCSVDGCEELGFQRGWCDVHYRRFSKYGLLPEQFANLLIAQGGGCAICGVTEANSPHPLVVDHDHSCCPGSRTCGQCVRGILCRSCNVGIGLLRDDKRLVLAAHQYLSAQRK